MGESAAPIDGLEQGPKNGIVAIEAKHVGMVDLILLVVLAVAVFDGYSRGFIIHACDLIILAPAIYLTFQDAPAVADWLVMSHNFSPIAARFAATLGIYGLVQGLGMLFVLLLYKCLPERVRTSSINRFCGIVPAVTKAAIYAGVVLIVLAALPSPSLRAAVAESEFAPSLMATGDVVTRWLGLSIDAAVERAFRRHTVSNQPDNGNEREEIPAVTDPAKMRVEPAEEDEMLSLVNKERKSRGVPPLRLDTRLRSVARAHSEDMWKRGYFSHEDPDGKDVADRVRAADIPFGLVGENIALAPSLAMAHSGLMNSEHHRDNILDRRFKRIGIGIVLAGSNGIMVTQNFGD